MSDLWGNVPTWIAAIGTTGAFIVYYQLLLRDREKQRRDDELLRCSTAKRTSAWMDSPTSLNIQNTGDEPVFGLVVYVGRMGTNFDDINLAGSWYELVVGTVGPGTKFTESVDQRFTSGEHFPDIAEVAVEFTDCGGVHWRRESNGRMHVVATRRPYC